jgi:hypothetical protein
LRGARERAVVFLENIVGVARGMRIGSLYQEEFKKKEDRQWRKEVPDWFR